MLRGIHKASAHWLGKLVMAGLFGFLALSFAVWGIGDIFRGFGRSSLAKIGSTEISIEQFRHAYNEHLQQLGRKLGRAITADQARALGLERQLLGQLMAEASLDEQARQLGLNLSDAEIAREITADANFLGPNGQFDRFRFQQMIRSAGFTEARYAAEQRRVALRRELADALSGGLGAPKTLADAVNRYQNEQRGIDYVALDRAQAGDMAVPTPELIGKYYEEHKAQFRAPEYRKIATLTLSAQDLARTIEVSEADARRHYEERRDTYGTPEKRRVEQIVFPNADEARAAADRIGKGTAFADLVAERGLKPQDVDLGLIAKSELLDRTVADAAFALPEGAVSAPVAGRFGTVLVHVTKIEAGHKRPYEEVAAEIKQQIAVDSARPQLLDLRDKIEDDRAAGMHLDEIAQKYKLTARTFETDRSGRGPDAAPIKDLPSGVDAVSAAFGSNVGVDNEALTLPGGGFVWYDVTGITPSRERGLDEVKEQVESRWRDDQVAQRLAAKASELIDKLKSGVPFAELAAQSGLKVEALWGLKRGNASGPLSIGAIDAVFQTPKDASGIAPGRNSAERIVFRVTEIKVPAFDPASAEAKRHGDTLRQAVADDLFGQYVAQLEATLGVTINEDALRRFAGGEADY
ncbi:MAG TPA: SurA N-terminal domain-containing protein [Xanthobacteraceae bacterium]